MTINVIKCNRGGARRARAATKADGSTHSAAPSKVQSLKSKASRRTSLRLLPKHFVRLRRNLTIVPRSTSSSIRRGKKRSRIRPLDELLEIMATLRSPGGCPWDREQTHRSLRFHAVEEVYELMEAIEQGDDTEMIEELGDLLLQVVFHCQLARERRAFDFEIVCRSIADKLIRRHPHVFGNSQAKTVEAVWAQWEQIKHAEKKGTRQERVSIFDGIPKHLPALLRAEKMLGKAKKISLLPRKEGKKALLLKSNLGQELFALASLAAEREWSAEELLQAEIKKRERAWRKQEARRKGGNG